MDREQTPTVPSTAGAIALADAADENFVIHAGWLHRRIAGMRVVDQDKLVLIDCGLPCDTFNLICHARLEPGDVLERASAAIAYFRDVRRPFSWWVGPADRPQDLGEFLVRLGLNRAETERAMVADIAAVRPAEGAPAGLQVRRARSARELQTFARLSAANWTPPDLNVVRFYQLAGPALLQDDCPIWLYLGYLGEDAVATAELTVGGGVVGLYNISTLPAYRRRGVGTAMTVQPLVEAREQGNRAAILQAAAAGVGIYERVGFRAYGEITEYKPGS
jgi:ribosomal protein S18 acetylase RimI-like enzyme